jgi:ribulose-phosphate 3-epimerase
MIILPSILSENFTTLHNLFPTLEECGIKAIHFDVMDNHFVPNLTFGSKFIADLRPLTSMIFDTHLMIENPLENLLSFIKAGANIITAHREAFHYEEEIFEALHICHQNDVKFGLALKPASPIESIEKFLPKLDLVLIMTVDPGFGGQPLLVSVIEKINKLHQIAKDNDYSFIIEADGGINKENIALLLQSGVEYFVMGSAFFKEKNYKLHLSALKEIQESIYKTIKEIHYE